MASYRACSLPLSRNTAVARFVCTLVRAACGFYNDRFPGWMGLPIAVRWSTTLRLVRRCVSAANVAKTRQPIAVVHPHQLGQQHGIAEKVLHGRTYGKAVVSEEPGAAPPVWVPIGMTVPTVAEPLGQGAGASVLLCCYG